MKNSPANPVLARTHLKHFSNVKKIAHFSRLSLCRVASDRLRPHTKI
uniref:Uncharacterized protein n=1 Tax=Anguilla anguilla TaxID=7936 RepID=A0A0E9PS11_ANGAN